MKTKSKSLIFATLLALMLVVLIITAIPSNLIIADGAMVPKLIGFAIKEHTDVYFAETGNNKVQNTYTGVDGKLTRLPELYRTDTLDYTFDGWYIANTDTKVTVDTVYDADVTLVDRWIYSSFDENYKVSTVTINNTALNYGTKQGGYSASVATANVDGITTTSGTTFTIYKGLNKSGDALVGDEEVEIGKNYSVATTITLKDGYKFGDQIHFYATNGLAADYKFKGNFWTTGWSTEANQVEVVINFVQSDDYYFTQQPESREFENYTEYHYYYTLNEEDGMEDLQGVQLQYYNNDSWTLFGPAIMVVSPYTNRTITFRLAASYEHGTIYSEPWTITWGVINQTIDKISLGIQTPQNGNTPSYLTSIADSRFKLASANDVYTKSGIKWSGSISGDLEVGNATFNNDEDYTISYKLVAQEGYSFDVENLTATINAQEADVSGNAKEVVVSYTFEKATPTTYSVYFNPSLYGTGTMATVVVNEGAEYELPECEFTPNANYTFAAWSVNGELKKPGDIIVVNGNEPVFAIWQASSTPMSEGFTTQPIGGTTVAGSYFTVSFEIDENIDYNSISVLEYDEKSGTWDGLVCVRDNVSITIDGKIKKYSFYVKDVSNKLLRLYANRDGVNVAKSDTFTVNFTPAEFTTHPQGTTVVNGSTYTFTWGTTFDARFRILYWDAEYNEWGIVQNGETTGHSFSVTSDTAQSITYKIVADIPYIMANGGTNYAWEVAESQSFIVSWVEDIPKYAVSYNGNGGLGSMVGDMVIEGGIFELDDCTFTVPEGKQFKGWAVGSIDALPLLQAGAKIIVTSDTVIYAIWEDIPVVNYIITFNANGGTGTMQSVEYAGVYTLPDCTFTAPEGKYFKGWATSAEGDVIEGTINITADTELFAIWGVIFVEHQHNHDSEWHNDANEHWNECECGAKANKASHTDENTDGKCDVCGYQLPAGDGGSLTPEKSEKTEDKGLSGGAIAGIVIGCVLAFGLSGFAIFWFAVKKKSWADFVAHFKKK